MTEHPAITSTRNWVEKMVIGLNLCPFAKLPFSQGQIHFQLIEDESMERQLLVFWKEIERLISTEKNEISNSLLIFPDSFPDFSDYLDFYDLCEKLLAGQGKDTEFQLASFHPNYLFDGVGEQDASNYTNRSPYPMIHVLRSEEVEEAIASHPNIESVPKRNVELLRELGKEGVKKVLGG